MQKTPRLSPLKDERAITDAQLLEYPGAHGLPVKYNIDSFLELGTKHSLKKPC